MLRRGGARLSGGMRCCRRCTGGLRGEAAVAAVPRSAVAGEVRARQHPPTTTASPALASRLVTTAASDGRCARWQVPGCSSCRARRRFGCARTHAHAPLPRPSPPSDALALLHATAGAVRATPGAAAPMSVGAAAIQRRQPLAGGPCGPRAAGLGARRPHAAAGADRRGGSISPRAGGAPRALGAAAAEPAELVPWGRRRRFWRLRPRDEADAGGGRLRGP